MTSLLLLTEESQIARTLIKAPTGAAFDFARIAEVVAHAVERRWKGRPRRHGGDARAANPAGAGRVVGQFGMVILWVARPESAKGVVLPPAPVTPVEDSGRATETDPLPPVEYLRATAPDRADCYGGVMVALLEESAWFRARGSCRSPSSGQISARDDNFLATPLRSPTAVASGKTADAALRLARPAEESGFNRLAGHHKASLHSRGPAFCNEDVEDYVGDIAERAVHLGGRAEGHLAQS